MDIKVLESVKTVVKIQAYLLFLELSVYRPWFSYFLILLPSVFSQTSGGHWLFIYVLINVGNRYYFL